MMSLTVSACQKMMITCRPGQGRQFQGRLCLSACRIRRRERRRHSANPCFAVGPSKSESIIMFREVVLQFYHPFSLLLEYSTTST